MIQVMRIENQDHMHGMWYDEKGNFDPIIQEIIPGGKAAGLPMGFCPLHVQDGKSWYSSGEGSEQMNLWFSRADAEKLWEEGFRIYRFDVLEWRRLEHEVIFTRAGVIRQEEISIDAVWK